MIETSEATPAVSTPGQVDVGGKPHLRDTKGRLVPLEAVKTRDLLIDEATRSIFGYAQELSAQIGRFKAHTKGDVEALIAVLDQEYGAKPGGAKGNITLTTFDGLLQVKLQVAEHFSYGPELQTAKSLVDECLTEWTAESHANIRALIHDAFRVDQEGKVSRGALLQLLRLEIDDERWTRAMQAIRDAERVTGSKEYFRFYRRPAPTAQWEGVPIDVAAA